VVAAGLVGAGLLSFSVERWLKQFLQHRIQQWRVTARLAEPDRKRVFDVSSQNGTKGSRGA
jgi:hypothetical protein